MPYLRQRKLNGGNDEFYTKLQVAEHIVNKTLSVLKPKENALFVEPSVGNGSFSNILKRHNKKFIAFDINPKTEAIKKNFLLVDFKEECIENAIFIGNPPFGFASSLAIKFFNKASEVATHIIFILPKTFRKESVQKKLNTNFHIIYESDLPKNSFLVDNKEHDVPCLFQIWEKRNYQRKHKKLKNGFIEYTHPDKADFVIRRVGGNAGKVFVGEDFKKFAIHSNYFCKALRKDINIIEILKNIEFSHVVNNTAGVRSLSKGEISNILHQKIKC